MTTAKMKHTIVKKRKNHSNNLFFRSVFIRVINTVFLVVKIF